MDGQVVYAKVSHPVGWTARLKSRLLGSAAQREWRATRRAWDLGISVPRPIAWGCQRDRSSRAVYLAEEVVGAESLVECWERATGNKSLPQPQPRIRDIICVVSELFAKAHDLGFVHRDAHPGNVVLNSTDGQQDGQRCKAYFLDVHAAGFHHRPLSAKQCLASLAQLDQFFRRNAGRGQRLRFLRSYVSCRRSLQKGWSIGIDEREVLRRYHIVSARHARHLAQARDKRLKCHGHYFTTLSLKDGWKATVVLKLERRHLFPESGRADFTAARWRDILAPLLEAVRRGESNLGNLVESGVDVEVLRMRGLTDRLLCTLRGSSHRKAFEDAHRSRHRDGAAPLCLAVVEHRQFGLIDTTMLLRVTMADPKR